MHNPDKFWGSCDFGVFFFFFQRFFFFILVKKASVLPAFVLSSD